MAKRKKYPKLPNGFGSIKYLGKGRRNCYAVHPPVTEFTEEGIPVTPKALCYVDEWMKGFSVLTAYHAGTYSPGMEKGLSNLSSDGTSDIVQKILADYSMLKGTEPTISEKTFSEIYHDFYDYKYNRDKSREYSASTRASSKFAFDNCQKLHAKVFRTLKHEDLQSVIDESSLKYSGKSAIVSFFHQIYAYAEMYELCEKDYSKHVKVNQEDDNEHGVAFTSSELEILWRDKDNPTTEMILIMCYSGYRITAYKTMEVNLDEKFFKGGVKTKSGKNRIVPIHSSIFPLVKKRMAFGELLPEPTGGFRQKMYTRLNFLGLEKHTPHDCRHTFSALCEKYGVSENDRKRMLGHSFGMDITNGVYGHRTLDDLRAEIEKIKVCF